MYTVSTWLLKWLLISGIEWLLVQGIDVNFASIDSFSVLEAQVNDADEKLKTKQEELSILMSYKDKEYPVKALKIADLQKEIAQLNTYQQVYILQ